MFNRPVEGFHSYTLNLSLHFYWSAGLFPLFILYPKLLCIGRICQIVVLKLCPPFKKAELEDGHKMTFHCVISLLFLILGV